MEKAIKTLLILLIVTGSLFYLSGCEKKEEEPKIDKTSIVGRWKYKNNDKIVYVFEKDGTGLYELNNRRMKFTYKVKKDNLSIKYEGNKDSFDTKYSIKGDILTIVDANGKDQLYKRIG